VGAVHDDHIFQANVRQQFANAVLRELLDMVIRRPPPEDNALGPQFNRQVADAPASAEGNPVFQFVLQFGTW
jgi:hypothetical protein